MQKTVEIQLQRQPREVVETPSKVHPLNDLDSAKCRFLYCQNIKGMKAKIDYTLRQAAIRRRVAELEAESNIYCMYRVTDGRYEVFKVIDRKKLFAQ